MYFVKVVWHFNDSSSRLGQGLRRDEQLRDVSTALRRGLQNENRPKIRKKKWHQEW